MMILFFWSGPDGGPRVGLSKLAIYLGFASVKIEFETFVAHDAIIERLVAVKQPFLLHCLTRECVWIQQFRPGKS